MTEFQTHLMYWPIHYLIPQITFPEYHPTPWHYPLIKETTDQLKFALVLCQMHNDDHCPCAFEFYALHADIITFKEIRSDCDFQIILLDLWDDWEPKRGGHFEDLSSAAYIEAGGNSQWWMEILLRELLMSFSFPCFHFFFKDIFSRYSCSPSGTKAQIV